MTLKEIIDNYNNLVVLRESKEVPSDLLESSIKLIEDELIEKIVNILEYRKSLIEEGKEQKRTELEEYLQYCLYIGRIDKIYIDNILIEVSKENIKIEERIL